MIVPVMAISNLVLTQQIYSEETNGAHAHYRELVPLNNWGSDNYKWFPLGNLHKSKSKSTKVCKSMKVYIIQRNKIKC